LAAALAAAALAALVEDGRAAVAAVQVGNF
jgi:hypothetical protein